MTDQQRFENFFKQVKTNHRVWLLQAKDGLFAMLEDNDQNSYIPVWPTEADAIQNRNEDWTAYQPEAMSLTEFSVWLEELRTDDILIGVHPDESGKILPVKATDMMQLLK